VPEPIVSVWDPLPVQRAFRESRAKIRGYGGAMGGGKSRTGCEEVFDLALDHPGIVALVARQAHTSIVETTKKTMLNFTIPDEVISRSRSSNGEDYVELWNGSRIHFVGLDDPMRWYSSEIGFVFFDEAQEIDEEVVLRLVTRLRQPGMPNRAMLTFNPGNPGHWLQRWFIEAGQQREFGMYKPELWMEGATSSLGDAEFFFAKAADNPYLPDGYVEETLGGMKEWMRRRYLEGLWEFISGASFFDTDALRFYQQIAEKTTPLLSGHTEGSITDDVNYRIGKTKQRDDLIRIKSSNGPLTVWKRPVRDKLDPETNEKISGHRYVLSIDSSSGRGRDYSAIQVIDVNEFEQVAEWQGKQETGLVAVEAYRLGRLYNDALIVTELTGGWGLAVEQVLKSYRYPKLYTKRVIDRLSQKWTDRTGFDTTQRMRNLVLEALETALRERELGLYSLRAINEMGTFVYSDKEKAEAQPGCNDDLVMALAIGVKVAADLPRTVITVPEPRFEPTFTAAGW
jgi:hypothetical protein